VLIEPLVEPAGFPEYPPMRFMVSGTGSCLNLRESPTTGSRSLACLGDGTLLTLDPEGELLWDGATQKYTRALDSTGSFVLVRTSDGARGWVSTQYLAWT
jgi:hypothetical protein